MIETVFNFCVERTAETKARVWSRRTTRTSYRVTLRRKNGRYAGEIHAGKALLARAHGETMHETARKLVMTTGSSEGMRYVDWIRDAEFLDLHEARNVNEEVGE